MNTSQKISLLVCVFSGFIFAYFAIEYGFHEGIGDWIPDPDAVHPSGINPLHYKGGRFEEVTVFSIGRVFSRGGLWALLSSATFLTSLVGYFVLGDKKK
jgi:hypothetical protein|tara:strand:- start:230 stop:526 length:297 start_codon:yes stop_codon:yes gene_type:complete